jgi:putative peptide zinc metalloprotease protein
VIKAGESQYVITGSSGFVQADQHTLVDENVDASEVLFRMSNPELILEIANLKAELAQIEAMERRSFSNAPEELAPLAERRVVTETKLTELMKRADALVVRAPVGGRLMLSGQHALNNRWFSRGDLVGEVVGGADWEFRAVVSQDDAGKLFSDQTTAFEIRFKGSASQSFTPVSVRLVPGRQDYLPSPALGWPSGGSVRLSNDDRTGLKAYEPFFLVVGTISNAQGDLWHGRTGVARFDAPPIPLMQQWMEDLRQLLQRRFKI